MDRRNLSGWFLVLVSIALAATAASALDAQTTAMAQGVSAGPLIVDFEGMEPGKLPRGFSTALTGKGTPPVWVIKEDPTAPAGLVWRYQDANNYYVVRANALEDNVVLYKMEQGKRSDLKPKDASFFSYGKDAPVPAQRWNTLRVTVRGQHFSVWLDGEHLFDVEDETFSGAGRVGLWTKADSVTAFDSLTLHGR